MHKNCVPVEKERFYSPKLASFTINKSHYISLYRYFLADTVIEEVTFGWPRQKADFAFKEQLALNLQNAFNSVNFGSQNLLLPNGMEYF